jgi:hypothetical protein
MFKHLLTASADLPVADCLLDFCYLQLDCLLNIDSYNRVRVKVNIGCLYKFSAAGNVFLVYPGITSNIHLSV